MLSLITEPRETGDFFMDISIIIPIAIGVIIGSSIYDFIKYKINKYRFNKIFEENEKVSAAILEMAEKEIKDFREKSDQSFINRMEMDKRLH